MNEWTVRFLSVAAVILLAGWFFRAEPTGEALRNIIWLLVGIGGALRIYALGYTKRTIIEHRRGYLDIWEKGRKAGNAKPELDKHEESGVILLGRLKGGKPSGLWMAVIPLVFLYYGDDLEARFGLKLLQEFGFAITLGQIYLSATLYGYAKAFGDSMPPDSIRKGQSMQILGLDPNLQVPPSSSLSPTRYRVEIDLNKFHDFIFPSRALPFWTLAEAEARLLECGFERVSPTTWEGDQQSLIFLERQEIISLEPK